MRTTNGLNVPGIGEGGRPGAYKASTSKARPKIVKPAPQEKQS